MSEIDTPPVDSAVDVRPIDSEAGSVPVVRPVVVAGARSAEAERERILADLRSVDLSGLGAPTRRLVADVPSLLSELEAVKRDRARLIAELHGVHRERDSLRGVVQAVEALHQKRTATVFSNHHHDEDHVSEDVRCDDRCFVPFDLCNGCGGSWPCSTARALAAAVPTCEHGKPAPHIYPNDDGGPAVMRRCPGPSPAVLPQPKEQR